MSPERLIEFGPFARDRRRTTRFERSGDRRPLGLISNRNERPTL